ncbi:hypothetical protein [Alkalicoccus saliphilus]|uniref:hypothetical protein n=1 Tax=Alkalicoccus saliphilus TaxID=200989 RepID=UPI00135A9AA3|nr:hypothetical protein [Alkalicoccus saliphilus]
MSRPFFWCGGNPTDKAAELILIIISGSLIFNRDCLIIIAGVIVIRSIFNQDKPSAVIIGGLSKGINHYRPAFNHQPADPNPPDKKEAASSSETASFTIVTN